MPQDERKRQKAIMKKRSKQKASSQSRVSQTVSPRSIILAARAYPIVDCFISSHWDKKDLGLIEVLISRQQPDGQLCLGFYLLDIYCLGLKNTLARVGVPRSYYQDEVSTLYHGEQPKKISAELAHQIIYGAIEYAAQFGFTPEKDFALTQYCLAPRGELTEPYKLTFGKNGKPFYVAGPYDNVNLILRQLDKSAGPGNYEYLSIIR